MVRANDFNTQSFISCPLDGLMGMALVGGITAAAVGALIAAYRLRRK